MLALVPAELIVTQILTAEIRSRYGQTQRRCLLGAPPASGGHTAPTAGMIAGLLIFHGKVGPWR
jgi:hypothetical protein